MIEVLENLYDGFILQSNEIVIYEELIYLRCHFMKEFEEVLSKLKFIPGDERPIVGAKINEIAKLSGEHYLNLCKSLSKDRIDSINKFFL